MISTQNRRFNTPITTLPHLSHSRTYYTTSHPLLSEQEYGFRSQHSTELACVKLVDYIIKEMDNIKDIKILAAMFLDLSKA